MTDPRDPRGVRHKRGALLTLTGLAVAAGCHGPHAIAEFAKSLSPGQLRRLRCRRQPRQPRRCEVPCERTFRRLLKSKGHRHSGKADAGPANVTGGV